MLVGEKLGGHRKHQLYALHHFKYDHYEISWHLFTTWTLQHYKILPLKDLDEVLL